MTYLAINAMCGKVSPAEDYNRLPSPEFDKERLYIPNKYRWC